MCCSTSRWLCRVLLVSISTYVASYHPKEPKGDMFHPLATTNTTFSVSIIAEIFKCSSTVSE